MLVDRQASVMMHHNLLSVLLMPFYPTPPCAPPHPTPHLTPPHPMPTRPYPTAALHVQAALSGRCIMAFLIFTGVLLCYSLYHHAYRVEVHCVDMMMMRLDGMYISAYRSQSRSNFPPLPAMGLRILSLNIKLCCLLACAVRTPPSPPPPHPLPSPPLPWCG